MHDFTHIEKAVMEAGLKARRRQAEVSRDYKADGSVLTEVDLETEKFLNAVIAEEFPEANIISEEYPGDFKVGRDYTFTVDPIDGTDSYSQGMPGWCVGVGILDYCLQPIGGIISAPRWGSDPDTGLFLSILPGKEPSWKGRPEGNIDSKRSGGTQLLIGSKSHQHFDYRSYPGKIRNLGSSILHLIGPLAHSAVEGSVLAPCYIWDIAAAHAALKYYDFEFRYINGEPIDYSTMVHRQKASHHMICGTPSAVKNISRHLQPISSVDKDR